jgi:hypothetical protein
MPDAMPTRGESVAINDRSRSRREEEAAERRSFVLKLGSGSL